MSRIEHSNVRSRTQTSHTASVLHAPTLYSGSVSAGFPTHFEEGSDGELNLDCYLIKNRTSTFFVRARGESMSGAHIADGDILVVDRSLEPVHGMIVVASVDGEFLVKRFSYRNGIAALVAEHDGYPPIILSGRTESAVWGVVVGVVRKLTP
jgi:DNA polymerase V